MIPELIKSSTFSSSLITLWLIIYIWLKLFIRSNWLWWYYSKGKNYNTHQRRYSWAKVLAAAFTYVSHNKYCGSSSQLPVACLASSSQGLLMPLIPTQASSWTLTDLNSIVWLSTNWILKFYKVGNLRMIKKKKKPTKTHWVINRKTNCVFRLMSMFFQYEVKLDEIVRTEKQNLFNNHSICKTCYYYCKEHNFLCPSLYLNIDSRMSH